ncbi:putative membrane protein [Pseudoxanthobacter soli DSM 19599]|uniref:Putative membrane protein n=1 Tax=Pseudoxanthobacter soli DSM 19599 TaxID=1123029 RepID=A0A1M7ZMI8_9HYPH|nr:TIGR01620 family protein [Pseudoxanthobacter soli]SHO66118.1 putative membrane protein [Pseudoxanthobacter soli DSM 19599]
MTTAERPEDPVLRRRPMAFRLDEAGRVESGNGPAAIEPEPEPEDVPQAGLEATATGVAPVRRRGIPWGGLLAAGVGGLVSLGIGLSIDRLIEDLFARAEWLGWVAAGLAAVAVVATAAIVGREVVSLLRLGRIDRLRHDAEAAAATDSRPAAEAVIADLTRLMTERPETARGRAALKGHLDEVIDGRDLLVLAEREILSPLDAMARTMVTDAAKRVSVVTALSPRAFVDILFVLVSSARLIARLARLYGGRPGLVGFIALARHVIGHLAVTGGIAAGDSILHEVIGKSLATRLSSRLGEGIVNGLMTARIGLAAIDVCRPLPFLEARRPRVSDVIGEVAKVLPSSREGEADSAFARRRKPAPPPHDDGTGA